MMTRSVIARSAMRSIVSSNGANTILSQKKKGRSYPEKRSRRSYPEIPLEFLPVSQLCGRHLSIQEVASWVRIEQRCSSHVRPCAPITDLNKCIVSSTWTCMKLFLWSISAPICGKQMGGCLSVFLEIHTHPQYLPSKSLAKSPPMHPLFISRPHLCGS